MGRLNLSIVDPQGNVVGSGPSFTFATGHPDHATDLPDLAGHQLAVTDDAGKPQGTLGIIGQDVMAVVEKAAAAAAEAAIGAALAKLENKIQG